MPTTLKTRPEVVAMRWAWLWLIASIIGLVLGLGLVLTFNHLIVVPYLHKGHVIDTDCYVTHIQIVPFEHANCTPFQPGVALKNLNCGRGLPLGTIPELCAKIRVLYYSTEGEMRNGVLHPDYEDTTLYPNDTLKVRLHWSYLNDSKNMEKLSALLIRCVRWIPPQRPAMRGIGVSFNLRLLGKGYNGWWFEMPCHRPCDVPVIIDLFL